MSISDWPDTERPREKLLAQGPAALSSGELLAIFLRTGVRGKSALDLARDLLQHFGSLKSVLNASFADFSALSGLGKAKYSQLQAVLELNRRYLLESLTNGHELGNSHQTIDYLKSKLGCQPHEVFGCLLLNTRHQVIKFVEIFRGGLNQASVYLGEVVKIGLQHHAAAIIVAHNHPSGDPTPSQADIRLTEQLKQALDLVDIRLLDHIILTGDQCFSFVAQGLGSFY